MRHRLVTVVIFLLAGAVVNVGVAWGCAVWLSLNPAKSDVREVANRLVRSPLWQDIWCEVRTLNRPGGRRFGIVWWYWEADETSQYADVDTQLNEILPRWAFAALLSRTTPPEDMEVIVLDSRGWPLPSLASQIHPHIFKPSITQGWPLPAARGWFELRDVDSRIPDDIYGTSLATWFFPDLAIPFGPIWPGFAVNTIFYATLLWLLTCLAIAVRRFLRLRRGLCPKCAYPMGQSAVCSECGCKLPRPLRAAT